MYAICIESSNKRGMGHFYRSLNLIDYLNIIAQKYILLINNNIESIEILKDKGINYKVVNTEDDNSNWETEIINNYEILCWINDRMDTTEKHSLNIKNNGIKLVTFDDLGGGAAYSDINIFGMLDDSRKSKRHKGCKVLYGGEYLVLNKDINIHKRVRNRIDKLIVTMGGSDTYGVTMVAVEACLDIFENITVVCGPNFRHRLELNKFLNKNVIIKDNIDSLIKEFYQYDLAITGGGITPFEANATGLPCIIVANELHEIEYARQLEKIGSSVFAGYYKSIDWNILKNKIDIVSMSKKGISDINTDGVKNIFNYIEKDKK